MYNTHQTESIKKEIGEIGDEEGKVINKAQKYQFLVLPAIPAGIVGRIYF